MKWFYIWLWCMVIIAWGLWQVERAKRWIDKRIDEKIKLAMKAGEGKK